MSLRGMATIRITAQTVSSKRNFWEEDDMGLWFYEDTPRFSFSLADELTELTFQLVRAGALEDNYEYCADVVDLAAARAAREPH